MATLAPGSRDGAGGTPPRAPLSFRARLTRRLVLALVGFAFAAGLVLSGGFLWFARLVPADEVTLDRDADGIVVLTGGSSRIADAIDLLAAGHGQRLLITGVHHATSSGEIVRLLPERVRCCVDLDRSAVNTLGNAVEARRWAVQRGFRSLIVVTSNYHMPRAMAELAHQLPNVMLIPFPVVSEKLRGEPWWHGGTARLLLSEYVKYLYAVARMRIDPDATQSNRLSNLHFPSQPMSASGRQT
ncbi:MAG: YdcF family protein [Xanthobacteraceae bacterium]